MDFTFQFVRAFLEIVLLAMPLLGTLFLFIVTVGLLAGRIESWSIGKVLIGPIFSLRAIERPGARNTEQLNVWTFSNCLTKQMAVIEPALRGFQRGRISELTIFDVQPVCL